MGFIGKNVGQSADRNTIERILNLYCTSQLVSTLLLIVKTEEREREKKDTVVMKYQFFFSFLGHHMKHNPRLTCETADLLKAAGLVTC